MTIRRRFAEELRQKAQIRTDALVAAFASVPRERFLGAGPWHIGVLVDGSKVEYRLSDTAEPAEVYRDSVIAIDPTRRLNNGEPSSLAKWIDALHLTRGETVAHIGSGTGYYTALLAHVVGPTGRVIAYEVDPDLAARAVRNLSDYPQVSVLSGNGYKLPAHGVDAIFVNCGVTHPARVWLDALSDRGRMLLPVTAAEADAAVGVGAMYLAVRAGEKFGLSYISQAGIFHCVGQRDDLLNRELLGRKGADWRTPCTLRLDAHEKGAACWLHGDTFCLSTTVWRN